MKYACEHDLINLEHLSSFHNYILMVMVLRYLSFDVNHVTIFKKRCHNDEICNSGQDPLMFDYK